ncbi:MAG: restriction endonuclease subunit S, partial [Proteobacteria bacterium]|nr:restriction endonuclease subunit S [Pseudomonadota bacterium]
MMNEKDNSNSAFAIQHSEFKVPEIRFKGFSGEWKNLVLGGNARFSKGQGYSKSDLVTSGSPIILYGRLYTKYQTVITEVDTFVNEKSKTIKSIGGEVIVPASGESPEDISRASVVNDPNVILGGDLNVIYPDRKIDSIFLALAISNGRIKKELSSKAQGKSVVHIRNLDLADLSLLLPSKNPEQIKIGNYFQKLDTLINQHQQKHDKLTNIKKAMLEKMFPKAGATMPEIRFKGFSGEWIGKKLNDEVEFFSGLTYSPNDIRKFGTLVLRSSNVKNGQLIQADNVYVNPEIVNCINVV